MSAPSPLPNRRPWMAFYVSDYLADTLHLSATQHGAYLLLISHYWVHGGLPTDEAMLQRIARLTPEEWASSRGTLATFFKDGWRHSRVERELAEAQEKYEKRANAGRCGGRASGNSRRSNASAMLARNRSNAEPTTTTYSLAKAKGETAPKVHLAEAGQSDWRTQLFREGVPILTGLTGKPTASARPLIGKWLKSSRDDCRRVLRVLEDARDANPIDPVAWIEAALRGPQTVASHEPNSWRM